MVSLVCLTIAVVCAIIARVLLLIAALDISIWWALGVLLPFGPLFFRLSYPDAARSAFYFRMATLGCVFLFVVLGPGASLSALHKRPATDSPAQQRSQGYASELVSKIFHRAPSNAKAAELSLRERRLDNEHEFERLERWNELLRLRKRDLLHSDAEGTKAYNIDVQEYNTALAAATAEKQALANAPAK